MKVVLTDEFKSWFDGVKDTEAKVTIAFKIRELADEGSVDVKPLRNKLFELRIFRKPGYRVYFAKIDGVIVLYGGIKKTQDRDIGKALALLARLEK